MTSTKHFLEVIPQKNTTYYCVVKVENPRLRDFYLQHHPENIQQEIDSLFDEVLELKYFCIAPQMTIFRINLN